MESDNEDDDQSASPPIVEKHNGLDLKNCISRVGMSVMQSSKVIPT